ncbi:MAG TPA: glycosyltransferase [Nitrospiria bacterium]|nr:glycosyltransferase [Nitrospiria bacterium]
MSSESILIREKGVVKTRTDLWDWILRGAIFLSLAGLSYSLLSSHLFRPLFHESVSNQWARFIERPGFLWIIMGTSLLAFRTFLWFRYRPFASASMAEAPSLTVIIPAYNEGAMVEKTVGSVAAALYPRERLEILVVDDGSRDDTWKYIERAAQRHPDLVTPIRFQRNQGKRAALAEGFRRARGEIVVTVDSDSVIDSGSLLALAGPFRYSNVGAVGGKVEVYNRRQGLIPRMLQVRYVLAFDFLRATQSTYRTVYCCPGALTAYRIAVVRRVLLPWERQTFLGAQCTYGEDRALTNFILSCGYDTVYQRTAVVRTVVPDRYAKLCKMYIRWDRSYIREDLRFLRIVWTRPVGPRLIAILDRFVTNLRYPVSYAALTLMVVLSVSDPWTIPRVLIAIGLMSGFYMLFYLQSERSWNCLFGVLYAYYSFLTLLWIFPYALLTIRSRSWMTR